MEFVFQAFMVDFNKRILELAEGKEPSKEQIRQAVAELMSVAPAMRTYGSSGNSDKVVLIAPGRTAEGRDSVATSTSTNKLGAVENKKHYTDYLVSRVMEFRMNGPEASTLAVTTHSLDSGNMSEAVNDHKRDVMIIMDAVIKGPGDTEIESRFNEKFMRVNMDYSMMEAVVELVERAYNRTVGDPSYAEVVNKEYGVGQDLSDIDKLRSKLLGFSEEIKRNRATIFSKDRVYGNMVSRNSGYTYTAADQITKEAETMASIAELLGVSIDEKSVKCKA
jgi:hypothetical protein